ncbi:MAG TPA: amidohydrolase family protein [Candidatus Binataceae bacterium]|nr:amidohydrolase family protein [Candidatus Binataceae bacterium]
MPQIIDADGHIVEPRKLWEEYVEPEFRDRVISIRRGADGKDEFWVNGERRRGPGGSIVASVIPGGYLDPERTRAASWEDVLPGSWDPEARIKVLDEEGIDASFLYPSFYLIYGDHDDPRVAIAACRAYNNWMADFCHSFPKRLFGVAPMPLQDVDAAVREMRRVVKELNFKAVFIRPNPYNRRRLCDPAYDAFWREAQELDIPVAVHSSFGTKMPALGADRYLHDTFAFHMVCHPFEQQAASMDVICGGVLTRFPKLRIGFLESGAGWAGFWLDRMDGHYEKMGSMAPWLKKRPSEYFAEQCYLSFDPGERTLAEMCKLGFDRNILWGSDFPHFDCTYPGVLKQIKEAISILPIAAQRNILTDNPKRFYKLED